MEPDKTRPEDIIRIWEKTVDTQMHFNEMSVKSRQLGFTFVAAALGVAALLLSRGEDFSILLFGFFRLHISVLLVATSIIAVFAIKRLDLGVYHRMLRGAVTFGEDVEENYLKKIVTLEKGMTQTVSHYSRYSDASKSMKDGKYQYSGSKFKTAEDRLREFYTSVTWGLIISAVVILFVTNFGVFQLPKSGG